MAPMTPAPALPKRVSDLSEAERALLREMQELQFGRFESLRVAEGKLGWSAGTKKVQQIKFGASRDIPSVGSDFELKATQAEFFGLVRSLDQGVIRSLDIRYGLPSSIDVERPLEPDDL